MTEPEQLDAIIIGTGQAGKPLAGALDDHGLKTAIIERGRVGGTCVIEGCTPTKTMVASARVAHLAGRAAEYGVSTGPVSVDMEVVRKRKRDIVDSWSAGSTRGMTRRELVELIMGEARFSGPRQVTVELQAGGHRVLEAERIFINAGARALVPPIQGLQDVPFLDNASVMELVEVPEHLLVLGGGFIGLEFGQMFRRFGARVTVLELTPRLLPREDSDVSEGVAEILTGEGVRLELGARVESVSRDFDGAITARFARDGEGFEATGSHLLVAIGRTPNTDTLDPQAAGIEVDEHGFIVVNDRLETSAPGIWALGDINRGPPFTHTAYDDYRIVRANELEGGQASRADRMVPYTLFTDPQLGRVGLTEAEAREQGYDVRVASLPMSRVARAIETAETRGFMKAVVDAATHQILGAAVLGIEGGEVATVLQMAMLGGVPYTRIRDGVFSHPTLSESLNNLFMRLDA
jgi:pyruvate/2-oxoglutarate dehydrogenase complex dihydrolipoamide dehydrogenase (E3) component